MAEFEAATSTRPLASWTTGQGAALTHTPVLGQHRAAELELFSDGSLIALLHSYPRGLLQIFAPLAGTRGDEGWRPVAREGVSGLDLVTAARHGRLWVHARLVHDVDRRFNALQRTFMDELAAVVPGLRPENTTSTLIVSSPTTQVPYHLDKLPSLLWQVRGQKRLWVYPSDTDLFAAPRLVEDIVADESPEYLPYVSALEGAAIPFNLAPGTVIGIPQHAPHRVENIEGLNVSLSTEITTVGTDRRNAVRLANRYFSRRLHLPVHATEVDGIGAGAKRGSYRAVRRLGLDRRGTTGSPPPEPELRVDPASADGVAPRTASPVTIAD